MCQHAVDYTLLRKTLTMQKQKHKNHHQDKTSFINVQPDESLITALAFLKAMMTILMGWNISTKKLVIFNKLVSLQFLPFVYIIRDVSGFRKVRQGVSKIKSQLLIKE